MGKEVIDLSILITGIRTNRWVELYNSILLGIKRYSFETIFIGPKPLPEDLLKYKDIKYIKDNGSPSRTTQMSVALAEGKYITILADDSIVYEDSLDLCMDLLLNNNPDKDLIACRHVQTRNYSGIPEPGISQLDEGWWLAYQHTVLRQKYVDPSWRITCNPLMSLAYYKELGGLDCRFHHVNFNVHDLTYRAQMNGSKVHLSPTIVANTPIHTERPSTDPLMIASMNNDEPLYISTWSQPREIKIDFDNWKESPRNWP